MSTGSLSGSPSRGKHRQLSRALLAAVITIVLSCGLLGAIVAGLVQGRVEVALPGAAVLRSGSDDFVLSNYSFQNGTTYFIDFKGYGLRAILEFQNLDDKDRVDVVINAATRDAQRMHRLISLPVP